MLVLTARRWPINFPDTPRLPHAKAAISRPKTTGAAIMVERRTAPPVPIPELAVSNALPTLSKALTLWCYFLHGTTRFPSHPRGAFWGAKSPEAGRTDPEECQAAQGTVVLSWLVRWLASSWLYITGHRSSSIRRLTTVDLISRSVQRILKLIQSSGASSQAALCPLSVWLICLLHTQEMQSHWRQSLPKSFWFGDWYACPCGCR